jgi:peptide/nickel transport system substrate-binding protein
MYRLLIIAIILSALSLNACGGGSQQPPETTDSGSSAGETGSNPEAAIGTLNRDPKTLVVVYGETADNMDPGQTLNVANNVVQRGIYEGMLRLKGSSVSEVEGVLAESWTTNEDKREWTFKIRQGVKFHDGSVCDAQAIYDSMARTLTHTLPASFILARFMGYEPDKVMKVVDPYSSTSPSRSRCSSWV